MGCLAPQVLAEFYAIITSRRWAGVPLTPKEACEEVSAYAASPIPMIYPDRNMLSILLDLLESAGVAAQHVHDAALAATMLSNGVGCVYTANVRDFACFDGITAINPFESPDGG